jgi:hypothetical protein
MTGTDDGEPSGTDEPAPTEPVSEQPAAPTPAKKGSPAKSFGGCLVLLVIVGSLVWGCTVIVGGGSSSGDDSGMAWVMCQNQVDKQLKAPATAGYPLTTEFTITNAGGTYSMDAWVDAENSFGANVRTLFHCNAKKMDGDTWGVTATLQQ